MKLAGKIHANAATLPLCVNSVLGMGSNTTPKQLEQLVWRAAPSFYKFDHDIQVELVHIAPLLPRPNGRPDKE